MEYGYTYDGEEQNDYSESTETYDNQINQDIVSMTESEISTYEAPRTFQKEFLTGKWAKKANMSITGAKHKRNMYLASRDRNHLACILDDTYLEVNGFDELTISMNKHPIRLNAQELKGVTSYCWRPPLQAKSDKIVSVSYFAGVIEHWNVEEKQLLSSVVDARNDMYIDIDYNFEGDKLAVAGKSGEVFFYDVETEQRQNISKFLKHSNRAQIVHWDKDLLYSFGWDGNLFVWDIRQTDPVATQFVTCPNKDSFVISEETLLVGLVQKKDNLLAFDLRKQGPVTRMTVESKQAAQSLPPNDKLAEIQILRRAHFDNSKYFVTTSHNNTLQLLDYNGAKMVSVYSYEALDQPVLALETSVLRSKVFFTGDGFYGGLEFDN